MARKMRAAIFSDYGGPEVIEIKDIPIPEPGPGEVRIKVQAASMNHLDLLSLIHISEPTRHAESAYSVVFV